jgi:hypothetical protein
VGNIITGETDKTKLWAVNTETQYRERKASSLQPNPRMDTRINVWTTQDAENWLDRLVPHETVRATLHASRRHRAGQSAQLPIHPYRQLSCDGNFRHRTAATELQPFIVPP